MAVKSPTLALFLEPFKGAAAEGAVVELKLRLPAGKVPALPEVCSQKRAGRDRDGFSEALHAHAAGIDLRSFGPHALRATAATNAR